MKKIILFTVFIFSISTTFGTYQAVQAYASGTYPTVITTISLSSSDTDGAEGFDVLFNMSANTYYSDAWGSITFYAENGRTYSRELHNGGQLYEYVTANYSECPVSMYAKAMLMPGSGPTAYCCSEVVLFW